MLKKGLLTTVAALSLMAGAAVPAHAEISIMYQDSFAALIESGIKTFEAETGERSMPSSCRGRAMISASRSI